MSFRKPCHMPFRKLIPSFTLTVGQMRDKTFETDVLILTEYNSDSFLNDLSIKRHWLTLISLCPTCSKSAFFLESYTTNGERSGLRNTWHERKNLRIRPSVFERKLNNFFNGSHLKCGNQLKQNLVKIKLLSRLVWPLLVNCLLYVISGSGGFKKCAMARS